jgi:hypothetical protein
MSELDDLARARFRELTARKDAIMAESAPLREARDEHSRQSRATEDQMNADIKKAEEGLFDIDQEIAKLVRFLTPSGEVVSQTGPRGTAEDLPS